MLLDDQYRIEQLHAHLRQVHLSRGLAHLAKRSAELWTKGQVSQRIDGEIHGVWQYAFLAQELIRVGSDFGTFDLDQPRVMHQAMHMANGIKDYFQLHDDGSTEERVEQRQSFLFRTAHEQFGSQALHWHQIPRYRSLFIDCVPSVRRPNDPDLPMEFEQRVGLSILEFMQIGFAVMTVATTLARPNFFARSLIESRIPAMRGILTAEKVERFFNATALNIDQFRAKLSQTEPAPLGLERYRLSPLTRFPVVQTQVGYVVPSVVMLLQRFTSGIYFDFLEPRERDRAAIQSFTSLFGYAFEEHVGRELGYHFGESQLRRDPEYLGGSRRGPDWTLLEGRQATLFECKTTRLTRVEREDSRIPDVRERLRQDIIDALLKLPTKIKHIRRRVSGFEDWPEIEDLECVIVTLEPWWPEMLTRETIDTELKGTPAEGLRYHLMWVEQLEHLGSYGSVTTIFDLLRRRWQAPTDWDTRKYLFEEAKRLGIVTRSPRLDHLAEEFFGQLTGGGTAEAEVG